MIFYDPLLCIWRESGAVLQRNNFTQLKLHSQIKLCIKMMRPKDSWFIYEKLFSAEETRVTRGPQPPRTNDPKSGLALAAAAAAVARTTSTTIITTKLMLHPVMSQPCYHSIGYHMSVNRVCLTHLKVECVASITKPRRTHSCKGVHNAQGYRIWYCISAIAFVWPQPPRNTQTVPGTMSHIRAALWSPMVSYGKLPCTD